MNNIRIFSVIFFLFFSFNSCKNETIPVINIDFDIIVTGEAPNATISIVNNTTGADTYSWQFSEGASLNVSSYESPSDFSVEKAGEFSVFLSSSSSGYTESLIKTVTIPGYNPVVEYENIPFAPDELGYGRAFSVWEGRLFADDQITKDNSDLIDFVFIYQFETFFYESADGDNQDVSEYFYRHTKIANLAKQISLEQFAEMENDSIFKSIDISTDNGTLTDLDLPIVITFQTQEGKKGAILAKEFVNGNLISDIKIQKY